MTDGMTIHRRIHFHARARRRVICREPQKDTVRQSDEGRVPRASRLMALAIHFEKLIETGEVADYAALAHAGHVSRARISQIMNLTLLAPDIQEAMLFLPTVKHGPDRITERDLRPLAAESDWERQREMWAKLTSRSSGDA